MNTKKIRNKIYILSVILFLFPIISSAKDWKTEWKSMCEDNHKELSISNANSIIDDGARRAQEEVLAEKRKTNPTATLGSTDIDAINNKKDDKISLIVSTSSDFTDRVCKSDSNSKSKGRTKINDEKECATAGLYKDFEGKKCIEAAKTVRDAKATTTAAETAGALATGLTAQVNAMTATAADAQAKQASTLKEVGMTQAAIGAAYLYSVKQHSDAQDLAEQSAQGIQNGQNTFQAALKDAVINYNSQQQVGALTASDMRELQNYNSVQELLTAKNNPRIQALGSQIANNPSYSKLQSSQGFNQYQDFSQNFGDAQDEANQIAQNAQSQKFSSAMTGVSRMLVGAQAMQAANLANQNQQNLASPFPTFPNTYNLTPALPPTTAQTGSSFTPADLGPTSTGPMFNDNSGKANGGIIGDYKGPSAGSLYIPKKSAVSSAGSSGAGFGGGTSGASKSPAKRDHGLGDTTAGEWLSGGGGNATRYTGNGGANDSNAIADVVRSVLGQPGDDKKKDEQADANNLTELYRNPSDDTGSSNVQLSDLSIFDQVKIKYVQLQGNGII